MSLGKGLAISAALLVSACNVQHTTESLQPRGTTLRAGIGDTVVTINQRKSLPNAFGAADIFGRTTAVGMVTVQYLGMNGDQAKFVRNSNVIETGATTVNTSPVTIDRGSAYIPRAPQAHTLGQTPIAFEVNVKTNPVFTVAGTSVRILSATATELGCRPESGWNLAWRDLR